MEIILKADPGSDITDTFQEAIDLSNRIQFNVVFEFNGVTCFVRPGGIVRKGVQQYHEAIKSDSSYKYARSF